MKFIIFAKFIKFLFSVWLIYVDLIAWPQLMSFLHLEATQQVGPRARAMAKLSECSGGVAFVQSFECRLRAT